MGKVNKKKKKKKRKKKKNPSVFLRIDPNHQSYHSRSDYPRDCIKHEYSASHTGVSFLNRAAGRVTVAAAVSPGCLEGQSPIVEEGIKGHQTKRGGKKRQFW